MRQVSERYKKELRININATCPAEAFKRARSTALRMSNTYILTILYISVRLCVLLLQLAKCQGKRAVRRGERESAGTVRKEKGSESKVEYKVDYKGG